MESPEIHGSLKFNNLLQESKPVVWSSYWQMEHIQGWLV